MDVDIFVYDTLENTVALDRSTDATAYAKLPKDFSLNPSVKIDKSIAGSEITIRPYEKEKYTVSSDINKVLHIFFFFFFTNNWLKYIKKEKKSC